MPAWVRLSGRGSPFPPRWRTSLRGRWPRWPPDRSCRRRGRPGSPPSSGICGIACLPFGGQSASTRTASAPGRVADLDQQGVQGHLIGDRQYVLGSAHPVRWAGARALHWAQPQPPRRGGGAEPQDQRADRPSDLLRSAQLDGEPRARLHRAGRGAGAAVLLQRGMVPPD